MTPTRADLHQRTADAGNSAAGLEPRAPRGRTQEPAPLARSVSVAIVIIAALVAPTMSYGAGTLTQALEPEILGPGEVTMGMDIEYSRFSHDVIRVGPGTLVTFIVRNDDPIHHELIVGPPEVHHEHAEGAELLHPPVPGEVSVGPHETDSTFYRFDQPGTVGFACRLPGHVAYGMVGTVEVAD